MLIQPGTCAFLLSTVDIYGQVSFSLTFVLINMDVQQPAPSLKRRHSMNESHVPEKVRRIGNIDEIKQSAIEGGKQCSYKYPSCGLVLSYTNHASTSNSKRKRLPNNTNIINNYKCMCSSPKRVKIENTTIQKFSFIAQKMEFKNEVSICLILICYSFVKKLV